MDLTSLYVMFATLVHVITNYKNCQLTGLYLTHATFRKSVLMIFNLLPIFRQSKKLQLVQ
jgi:hypothetical protein